MFLYHSPFGCYEEEFDTDDFIKEEDMIVPEDGCSIGDHVVCKTRDRILVTRFEKHDGKMTFTLIGRHIIELNSWDYVAYIPEYEATSIRGAFSIRPTFAEAYGIKKKFIGDLALIIRKSNIVSIAHKADGMSCCKCDTFCMMAKANQKDGTLICYSCRQNPYL